MFGTDVQLHRHLEVVEVEALHQLNRLNSGRHQRLDGILVLQVTQMLRQRTAVNANAQRSPCLLGKGDHLGHLLGPTDVARIQTHTVRPGFDRLQSKRMVEVNVGDHGNRRVEHDLLQRLDILLAWHRHPHDVGPGVGHFADLLHRGREVRRLGLGHRLHGHGRPAADGYGPDVDLTLRSHGHIVGARP